MKHSKKFFFRLDPQPVWNKSTRTLRISGWCVARDGTSLTAIRARNPEIVEAPLDRERPEIAKYFSGAQACAPCGFVLDLKVPKRPARLAFDAADAKGDWQQVFFTTTNGSAITGIDDHAHWDELNAPMRYGFSFDHPTTWTEPRRMLYVAGWCVDRTGAKIQAIRARAGSLEFPANYGIERVDVAAYLPGTPNAESSGFSIAIPVPKHAVDLKFEVRNKEGEWQQFFSHAIPGRSKTAKPEQLFAPPDVEFLVPGTTRKSRFRFWLDRPSDWSKKIRYQRISGWCVAMSGESITELRGRIGKRIFPAHYGISRPDVAKAVGRASALGCGFTLDVVVPRRRVTLFLEARSTEGTWETFFQYRICSPLFPEKCDIEGSDA